MLHPVARVLEAALKSPARAGTRSRSYDSRLSRAALRRRLPASRFCLTFPPPPLSLRVALPGSRLRRLPVRLWRHAQQSGHDLPIGLGKSLEGVAGAVCHGGEDSMATTVSKRSPKPALHIPATSGELRLIGELVAIQGQIEHLMQQTIELAFHFTPNAAQATLGSSGLGTNVNTWHEMMKSASRKNSKARAIIGHIYTEIAALTSERNDFLHAFYCEELIMNGQSMGILYGPRPSLSDGRNFQNRYVARRTRSGKMTPIANVRSVRDRAARVSRVLNQFTLWMIGAKRLPTLR